MKIKWSETVKKGLKFSVNPRFWLPAFVCDFIFFMIGLSYILLNETEIVSLINIMSTGAADLVSGSGFFSSVSVIFAAWILVRLWIQGALIRLSQSEKDYTGAFIFSGKRYLHLLAATIIIGAISMALGYIPYIGVLLSLVVSIILFFTYPGIIVSRFKFWPALKDSYEIFRKQVREFKIDIQKTPFQVWLIILVVSLVISVYGAVLAPETALDALSFWLLVAVFSGLLIYSKVSDVWAVVAVVAGIIFFVFFSIFMGMVGTALAGAIGTEGAIEIAAALMLLKENVVLMGIAGIILSLGVSISTVFSLKAMTDFYMQLKKKPGIF